MRRVTRGYTLVETLMVLAIAGLAMAIAIPRAIGLLDRLVVDSAASDVRATISYARNFALASASSVGVEIDSATGTIRVRRGDEVLLTRPVAQAHGVRLASSRDSLAYGPRGLGRGAANLNVAVSRGSAAETVFVSRLGRVR